MKTLCVGMLIVMLTFKTSLPIFAAPLSPQNVPEPLQPWIPWVLHGHEQRRCPFFYNDSNQNSCRWPSRLELQLTDTGGTFAQQWRTLIDDWIPLPGDNTHWPQEVQLNNQAALVSERDGGPRIFVSAGTHTVSGVFVWESLPEALAIPTNTGLILLVVNSRAVPFPDLREDGRLWLQPGVDEGEAQAREEDRVSLKVYRRVIDDIPLQLVTHLALEVSGKQRELLLGPATLEGYIPMSLDSPLPARLEPDGQLRIQVRPGQWNIMLTVRHPGPVTAIPWRATTSLWAEEEVWVFDARNNLRLVTVEGVPAIDPQQTAVPEDWRRLPTYRLRPGDTFRLVEKKRGDPDPAPDHLTLERNLWLDFAGTGYTIQDHISGTMTRGWRLEMNAPVQLGRVAVDGQDRFITRRDNGERAGVEVRRGQLQLVADSRLEGNISQVPAVGWEHNFQQLSGVLHLPPGWRLFSTTGVDYVPDTWVERWTLLDAFLVLFLALATTRLWGRWWGMVAVLTLVLIYHEPDAPVWIWLNLLAAVALLRVLPEGRAAQIVRLYRHLSVLALLVIAIPFIVQQVRQGLYPQLERPWQIVGEQGAVRATAGHQSQILGGADVAMQPSVLSRRKLPGREREEAYDYVQPAVPATSEKTATLTQYDPNARIQTGPGVPQWQWTSIPLQWYGPVEQTQQMRLWLLSPRLNFVLVMIRVFLLAVLILGMSDLRFSSGQGLRFLRLTPRSRMLAVLIVPLSLLILLDSAQADIPSADLLNELRTRLLAPPDCLPQCAVSPRLRLAITATTLHARSEVHAAAAVAVPLPGRAQHWLPHSVQLNGQPASGLLRREDLLWITLPPGRHQIFMEGPLPERETVQIPLPLKPYHVEVQSDGWVVGGLHAGGVVDDTLQLSRVHPDSQGTPRASLEASTLPAFVRIERTLQLGLTWQAETVVTRLTPIGSAVVLEVPLPAGESVTSDNIRVEAGKVLLSLAPAESTLRWSSVLATQEQLHLQAPDTIAWTEIWRLDVSPIWHAETTGIPVVHHQAQTGQWLPEWRPWPGEQVTVSVSRPEGVTGQTLTIESSHLELAPGQRAVNASLRLAIRSSQGSQHAIALPESAQLQSVSINGQPQPIRQEGRAVTVPVVPASQSIELNWQQPEGMTRGWRTPLVDLGVDSVNGRIQVHVPGDRWVLFVGGPLVGPAVLFWAVIIVVIGVAVALGRLELTPLRTHHWVLLGIGLTPAPLGIGVAVLVVGWLLVLGWRRRLNDKISNGMFNAIQICLGGLTVGALMALLYAIAQDLLGRPNMYIIGNGSTSEVLQWYQDKAARLLPQAWLISVPMQIYRIAALAWSLWLAFALLRWLRWGWECFSSHGLWRPIRTRLAATPP